jgi:molybdate transport system regulatory protein
MQLPSLKIRIELDAEGRIGPGKIRLLEAINTCGSISAASRLMNMTYRRAWSLVDEVARIFNRDIVVGRVGGNDGGGAELTPFGLELVARYREIERSIERATREELLALEADIRHNRTHRKSTRRR